MSGRRHDATGRSTGEFADRKFRERNRPPAGQPFIWLTRDILESSAYQTLSLNGHKVIARLALEHMAHGGGRNGQLRVTYSDFERFGIRRRSIRSALAEVEVLGFVFRTQDGKRAWGEFGGSAAEYRLTWLPASDGTKATNEWHRHTTPQGASEAVAAVQEQIRAERRNQLASRLTHHSSTEEAIRALLVP
jgi:hypothetical protein